MKLINRVTDGTDGGRGMHGGYLHTTHHITTSLSKGAPCHVCGHSPDSRRPDRYDGPLGSHASVLAYPYVMLPSVR